jgi:hypothetical protein
MAALASLQFARPSYMTTRVGSVDSQGDAAMRSDVARTTFGVDGTGVTVGTLSDSFDCLGGAAGDVASGDLPTGIVVLDDFIDPGCIDEGRAMMQLIADVAPGAAQAFHTALGGQANFALGIQELAGCPPGSQMGCTPDPNITANVIVDDIIYFVEPMFQDGIIAQAVDTVKRAGVAYFSAAGNDKRKSYETPSGFISSTTTGLSGGPLHDFDPGSGVDVFQNITIPVGSGTTISFQWDSPFFSVSGAPGSPNDLDIFLTGDGAGMFTPIAGGNDSNVGGDAVEIFSFINDGSIDVDGVPGPDTTFNIALELVAGPPPGFMKYIRFDAGPGVTVNELDTASSTLFGHPNAAGAEAVGAAFFDNTPEFGTDPPLLEPFSSAGPTPILFDTGGIRLPTPEVRDKPEIVAPDGTNTTFFGSDIGADPDAFPNFFGTSAAAPHAAGMAALLKELDSSLTPDEIYSALETTAIDMNGSGFDFDTGFGLIQADAALDTGPSERLYTLSVVSSGDGAGSITSAPPGIDCGVDCSETYVSMTPVTLTATPEEGSAFTGWSEASCPGTAPCVVTMTEDRTITATFKRLFSLSVTKAGTGDGTITSDLPGIDCGNDCSETYVSGSTITLTTTPAPDSRFIGWSGDCSGGDACVVTMTEDRAVTAVFEGNPPPVANAGVDQTVDEGILVLLGDFLKRFYHLAYGSRLDQNVVLGQFRITFQSGLHRLHRLLAQLHALLIHLMTQLHHGVQTFPGHALGPL